MVRGWHACINRNHASRAAGSDPPCMDERTVCVRSHRERDGADGLKVQDCRSCWPEAAGLPEIVRLFHKRAFQSRPTYSVQMCWLWSCEERMILEERDVVNEYLCIPRRGQPMELPRIERRVGK